MVRARVLPKHTHVTGALDIALSDAASVLHRPVAGGEAVRGLAIEAHVRRGPLVASLDLAGPEVGLDANGTRQRGGFLQAQPLVESDILAPPDLLDPFGHVKQDDGKLPDHERLVAQLAEFGFDDALHDAHGRHDDDDREDADQDAQEGQGRAKLMGGNRAQSHS